MPIGKIIIVDDKTWSITGKVSGNFMMNGVEAQLVNTSIDYDKSANIPNIKPENYIHHSCTPDRELPNMYGLQIYNLMQISNCIYGNVDLGYFTTAILFVSDKLHHLESGGTEWPIWQEKELRGYKIPIINDSNQVFLEDVCFGKAQWIKKEIRGQIKYVNRENLYTENAAQDVIGISREQFRKLAQPIMEQLKNHCKFT